MKMDLPMLDYASLSALAAVIREGSFERAAATLHVTPSAVSQRIRSLEERMGCALVVRDQPAVPRRQDTSFVSTWTGCVCLNWSCKACCRPLRPPGKPGCR